MLDPLVNGHSRSPTASIYILGSGCPTPTPDRYGTAFAVKTESDLILVDCGPATTWKIAKAGLNPRDFSTLLLSHHHFDHNVDTPCFILTRWDQNGDSQKPLQVFGPQPTRDFCAKISGPEGAYFPDWNARCNWKQSLKVYEARGGTLPRRGPVVQATDIQPGWTHATKTWKATAGYADHAQPFLDCVGYRFELPSRKTFVFSGDTGLCDEMVELARDADLFFCMSSGADMNEAQSEMAHCAQGAANPRDAGIMAQRAGVKTLVLVHQGPGQALKENWSRSIDAAKAVFSGKVVFGEELMKIDV